MVDIEVKLLRGCVYLAGEPIRCQITFTNTTKLPSQSNELNNHVILNNPRRKSLGIESIAWASAQIHCQYSINDSRIHLPHDNYKNMTETTRETNTSFTPAKGERGRCLLSTKPTILFCDLTLAAGESKSYYYEDILPFDAPPSYKGLAVKYCYKITVGAGRLQCGTTLVRLPFRVLVLEGLQDLCNFSSSDECSSNPFLNKTEKKRTLLDAALEKLTSLTYKRNQYVYNVVNRNGRVGCFILFKSAYKIGDEILGIFDFRNCEVQCTKLIVTLQSEEDVFDKYKKEANKHLHSHTSHSTLQEFCLFSKKIQLQLPIPVTAVPEFTSDIVDVRWRLHFEFYLSTISDDIETSSEDEHTVWQGPSTMDIEPMIWDLPIKIVACDPIHGSTISLLKTTANARF